MGNKSVLRLSRRSDFENLSKFGRRIFPEHFLIINFKQNKLPENRIGWTVPKYVGSAVTRNKLKRWCREVTREWGMSEGVNSYDINIVFKRRCELFYKRELDFNAFKKSLEKSIVHIAGKN